MDTFTQQKIEEFQKLYPDSFWRYSKHGVKADDWLRTALQEARKETLEEMRREIPKIGAITRSYLGLSEDDILKVEGIISATLEYLLEKQLTTKE